jgi:hypothetical protein
MNLQFDVAGIDHLVVAGWTGRDRAQVEHHIAELQALGVARPSSVPLFYRVAASRLTQADVIEVAGSDTSGEVEPFVFRRENVYYLSIASDHTDRALESYNVALSKQVCCKPVAKEAWPLAEVITRWDQLQLRSWIVQDGREVLYQDGTLDRMLPIADLLDQYTKQHVIGSTGFGMSCGTLAALGGIRPSHQFRMELRDPATSRFITHAYRTTTLPIVS